MHLAYLDDSDTKSKTCKWQVMAGVIIQDSNFTPLEMAMGVVREQLMLHGTLDQFEEFHACELYGGHGVFKDITQEDRFQIIWKLLSLLSLGPLPVIYGAVDLSALNKQIYASADPLDISFRMCCEGIERWLMQDILKRGGVSDARQEEPIGLANKILGAGFFHELVMVVVDDCEDKKIKNTLHKSYLQLRPQRRFNGLGSLLTAPMFHFHDDMYFGDSRYSMGIQLADLCAYFVARHLNGDSEIDGFYRKIEPHLHYAELHPKTAASDEGLAHPRELTDGK